MIMMTSMPMMMPMLMMVPMLVAGVYIMPLAHTWPDPAEVLVQTSGRNYTVRDYPAFFRDIGFSEVTMMRIVMILMTMRINQGYEMMENIISHVNLTHPGVRMACVFSSGVDTPAKLVYRVSQEELNNLNYFIASAPILISVTGWFS